MTSLLAILMTSCETQEESSIPEIETLISVNEHVVLDFIEVFNETNNSELILGELTANKFPISLETISSKISKTKRSEQFLSFAKTTKNINQREAYEFWLHFDGNKIDPQKLLVAFSPENAEKLNTITAFDLKGNKIALDPMISPDVPVIIIEKNGFYALQLRVEAMNQMLKDAGLQSKDAITFDQSQSFSKASLETTKLTKIELKDDQEPWIKGGAEIYAVTSGIRNTNNEAELKVIPMYYLDHDDEAYYPNQIMLFWDEYRYQAANIQLFEQDSNYNYQELIGIIIDGVAQIAGTLSGQSWINALGTIAGAIIEVLPDSWLTDDDDYVDSFYTIEKNKSYSNYYGASGNAKVNLIPFAVLEN